MVNCGAKAFALTSAKPHYVSKTRTHHPTEIRALQWKVGLSSDPAAIEQLARKDRRDQRAALHGRPAHR